MSLLPKDKIDEASDLPNLNVDGTSNVWHEMQKQEYVIDFDKIETIEDIIEVLKALDIKIYGDEFVKEKGIEHILKKK